MWVILTHVECKIFDFWQLAHDEINTPEITPERDTAFPT